MSETTNKPDHTAAEYGAEAIRILEGLEAGRPFTGHIHQSPSLLRGDFLQEFNKDARCLAVLIQKYFRLVLVDSNPHGARLGLGRAC